MTMSKKEYVANNIPFQVQNLIDGMLNSKDNIYLRGNFRSRLDIIKLEIENAIKKYDADVMLANASKKHKRF